MEMSLKKYVFPEISLSSLIIRKNKNVFEIKIHGEIYNIYKFRLIELSSIKSFLLLGINFVVGRFELFFLVQLLSQLVKVLFKKHPSSAPQWWQPDYASSVPQWEGKFLKGIVPEKDSFWIE